MHAYSIWQLSWGYSRKRWVPISDFVYPTYDLAKNQYPIYDCCGQDSCPKHKGLLLMFLIMMKKQFLLRNVTSSRQEY